MTDQKSRNQGTSDIQFRYLHWLRVLKSKHEVEEFGRDLFQLSIRQANPQDMWSVHGPPCRDRHPTVPSLTSSRKPAIYAGQPSSKLLDATSSSRHPSSSNKSTHGFPPEVTFRSFRCHALSHLRHHYPSTAQQTSRPGPTFGMTRGRIPLLAKVRHDSSSPIRRTSSVANQASTRVASRRAPDQHLFDIRLSSPLDLPPFTGLLPTQDGHLRQVEAEPMAPRPRTRKSPRTMP